MRAGTLKKRVTIRQPVEGEADALGEKPVTWDGANSFVAKVWAAVLPESGREFYRGQQVRPELTHLLSIRYRSDVTEAMRVEFGTRVLNIVSVQNVNEANRETLLFCVEDRT